MLETGAPGVAERPGGPLPPRLEGIIARALWFYADHAPGIELSEDDRQLAKSWHHTLNNDTWLLQTCEDPHET